MSARAIKSLHGYRGALFNTATGGVICVTAAHFADRNAAAVAALELLTRYL